MIRAMMIFKRGEDLPLARPVLAPVCHNRMTGAGLPARALSIQISAILGPKDAETGGGGHLLPTLAASRYSRVFKVAVGIVAHRKPRSACMMRTPGMREHWASRRINSGMRCRERRSPCAPCLFHAEGAA
jgi:hypothetical protein